MLLLAAGYQHRMGPPEGAYLNRAFIKAGAQFIRKRAGGFFPATGRVRTTWPCRSLRFPGAT
jgi:hypothetical protein